MSTEKIKVINDIIGTHSIDFLEVSTQKDGKPKRSIRIEKNDGDVTDIIFGLYDDTKFYECPIVIGNCKYYSFRCIDVDYLLTVAYGSFMVLAPCANLIMKNATSKAESYIVYYLKEIINFLTIVYNTKKDDSFLFNYNTKKTKLDFKEWNFKVKASDFRECINNIEFKFETIKLNATTNNYCVLCGFDSIDQSIAPTVINAIYKIFNIEVKDLNSYDDDVLKIFIGKNALNLTVANYLLDIKSYKEKIISEFELLFEKSTYLQKKALQSDNSGLAAFTFLF